MSFRAITRLPVQRTFAVRSFSSTAAQNKSVVDTVKETADAVNKKVGQALASGIEATENVTQKAKVTADQADPVIPKSGAEAKQDVNQLAGAAKGKMRDLNDETKKAA